MSKQQLDGAHVGAGFQQVDREGVAHTVPVQVDMPLMGVRGAVEGGKQEASDTGRKVNVK
jgi:hypothetical protein